MRREIKIKFKGEVEHRHEADHLLTEPGAAVIINRGVIRSIAIACPDGCGENLTINLDSRAGPAWRYYRSGPDLSLFPSIWRENGCRSHFIIWRSRIYWCDLHDEFEAPIAELVELVRKRLTNSYIGYVQIADQLNVVPWAVLSACDLLCRQGLAVAGSGERRGQYKLLNMPNRP